MLGLTLSALVVAVLIFFGTVPRIRGRAHDAHRRPNEVVKTADTSENDANQDRPRLCSVLLVDPQSEKRKTDESRSQLSP